jgi:hypothetical protein
MYSTKSKHLVLGAGIVQLGILKQVTPLHLVICSEGMSFLLGELPHIKGKTELALESERQKEADQAIDSLKELLSILRDESYEQIAKRIALVYKEYTNSLKSTVHSAIPNEKLKQIHEEIKDLLTKERVSLIFQEAFNESASYLEEFVFAAIQNISKQKAEV